MTRTVLVTGASGFIGKTLTNYLAQKGYEVRAIVRSDLASQTLISVANESQLNNIAIYNMGELSERTNWSQALEGVDTVIHCAARAHILNETESDPLDAFRKINGEATLHLAHEAIKAKVRRFIYLSSIGVLGNCSFDTPFSEHSIPNPQLPYAQSKWEAEQALQKLSEQLETVIIRPPLVYGPGVKGNFDKLLKLVNKGLPLPFGKINNKRQFIGLANLVDFITHCVESRNAAHQTFLPADKEVITTTQLIKIISKLMNKKIMLLPVPEKFLYWLLQKAGKEKMAEQLLNNLEINASNARLLLNWEPPYTFKEQMKETVQKLQYPTPNTHRI